MIKKILQKFVFFFGPKPKIQFFRFGFNISGYLREDLKNCFFGTQNLLKHFQAPDIIKSLEIKKHEKVLDFGCGNGYITLEIAKLASKTVGIDINPFIKEIKVPTFLNKKIKFYLHDEFINLEEKYDKILISEVILSVDSAENLLKFLNKKLKPNGKLILVNGLPRRFIKNIIYTNKFLLSFCKFFNNDIPESYEIYEKKICKNFGNQQKKLFSIEKIKKLFHKTGYKLNSYLFSPSSIIGSFIELRQFLIFPNSKNPNFFLFVLYRIVFSFLKFYKEKYTSGLIAIFSKR